MEELIPCPFCGITEGDGYISVVPVGPHYAPNQNFAVFCENCSATGPVEPVFIDSEKKSYQECLDSAKIGAIKTWNERIK